MAKPSEIDIRENYFKNYLINGDFPFWQHLLSSSSFSAGPSFFADHWAVFNAAAANSEIDVERSTELPPNSIGAYSMKFTKVNGSTSNNNTFFFQKIEGHDVAELKLSPTVFIAKMRSSVTGTYSFWLRSGSHNDVTNAYVQEFTLDANVWKTVVIPVPPLPTNVGTWDFTTGTGLTVAVTVAHDTGERRTSNIGVWETNENHRAGSNQVDWSAVAGATFNITDAMFLRGNSELAFRRASNHIGTEFQMCQRYFEKSYLPDTVPGSSTGQSIVRYEPRDAATGGRLGTHVDFKTPKNGIPTITIYDAAGTSGFVTKVTTTSGTSTNGEAFNIPEAGDNGFNLISQPNSGGLSHRGLRFHWTAIAELP